jgi:hypothetical protein
MTERDPESQTDRPPRRLRRWGHRLLVALLLGLVSTLLTAELCAVFMDLKAGQQASAEALIPDGYWTLSRWQRIGVMHYESVRKHGKTRSWAAEQAMGRPDSPKLADATTAWATAQADMGKQWLMLQYAAPVRATHVHVYENCAPGSLYRVTVFDARGREHVAWEGKDPGERNGSMAVVSKVPLRAPFAFDRVRLYLDTSAVSGWNEVDAAALIDGGGKEYWAVAARASSVYGYTVSPLESAQQMAPGWSTLNEPTTAFAAGEVTTERRAAAGFGWPWPALGVEWDMDKPPGPGARARGAPLSTVVLSANGDRAPALPWRPIVSGLVLGTLVHAALWMMLLALLTAPYRFTRELMRLRRGCCIRCGYDLRYDFPRGCPECGWLREGRE